MQEPKPGDVISFDGASTSGHTGIVVGSNVDSNGDGTIKTLNQNRSDADRGYLIHKVSKWQVAASLVPVQ